MDVEKDVEGVVERARKRERGFAKGRIVKDLAVKGLTGDVSPALTHVVLRVGCG